MGQSSTDTRRVCVSDADLRDRMGYYQPTTGIYRVLTRPSRSPGPITVLGGSLN